MEIYQHPEYYLQTVFFRDFQKETQFLLDVFKENSKVPLSKILDIACGPAIHALRLV